MPLVKRFEPSALKNYEDDNIEKSDACLDYQEYCAGLSRRDLSNETRRLIDDGNDSDDEEDQTGSGLFDWGCLLIGFRVVPRLMVALFAQFVKVCTGSVISIFRWGRGAKFY